MNPPDNEICPTCGSIMTPPEQSGETAASRVARAFGGVGALSCALGINRSTVYRWDYPKEQHGCGGRVPSVHHQAILEAARERGIPLTRADLVNAI